ncbi:MAG: sulfatase [Planctomycetota bacterium]
MYPTMRLSTAALCLAVMPFATAFFQAGPGWAGEPKRPNVLLICVDDLRNCLEPDGDKIAETPNLDRLASEGRYFRRHFVQVAACGPSRGSMLTGRRIIHSWDVWNADRKLAAEPKNPVSLAHHFRRHGYADYYLAQSGIEELNRLARQPRPFLLAVGFYKPHLPHNAPKKYWDMFPAEKVGMPDNFYPPENVDPSICIHKSPELTRHYDWPSGVGNISREEAIRQRRAYYAAVAYVDGQIGRLLDALRGLDCARETIVVLWSDHGWQLGEHHMFSKHSNYEVATNSPLVIRVPGMVAPGAAADGLVEAVDLFPTLTDLCGLPTPEGLAGQSLRAMVEDPKAPGKEAAYSTHPGGRGFAGHALRTNEYRLVRWINQQGEVGLVELYDRQTDPGENVNIAQEHPDVIEELTRKLAAKMDQVVRSSHAE